MVLLVSATRGILRAVEDALGWQEAHRPQWLGTGVWMGRHMGSSAKVVGLDKLMEMMMGRMRMMRMMQTLRREERRQ